MNKQGYGYRFTTPITPPGKSGLSPRSSHFPHSFSGETSREPARLIGRDAQLRTVSNLLLQGRLVTLTGPGGVGKTRLALRAAADMAEHFCDGFWVVELAALNNADMLASAVAAVLGVQLRPKVAPHEALSRHVKGKSLLIVLDNCEHVIFEAAGLVEGLLNGAPGVKVLATSREMLSCSGEQVVEVPPLALPDQDDNTPDQIRATPSIELFVERAIAADTAFRVADEDLSCVVKICRRVDGLPLAIEMAAAWAGPLGLQTLEAKLDGSLKAWLRARSTAPVRHSTLRATLEWSHSLLTPAEQTVFRRLAVFPDTFSMEGAEAIAADDAVSADQVFEHVANLRRKSMISVVPEAQTQRFRLLETTRAFLRSPKGRIIIFDYPHALDTFPASINSAREITGSYLDGRAYQHGFIRTADGSFSKFDPPKQTSTTSTAINRAGTVAGYFTDIRGVHAFQRNADGTIAKFDVAHSTQTNAFSINNRGQITGAYSDSVGNVYGYVRNEDGAIKTFGVHGSLVTVPQSIGGHGAITGYYHDSNNVQHGFLRSSE